MRATLGGDPETVVSFERGGDQTGLVIDEDEDMFFIGFASSSRANGIGIMRGFLLDTSMCGNLNKLAVYQHIP